MRVNFPATLAAVYVLSGLLALLARENAHPIPGGAKDWLLLWYGFKPLTTLLLFLVVGVPHTRLQWFVTFGLIFSLIGDLALLSPAPKWFQVGLGAFLVAHVCYIVAFSREAVPSWRPIVTGVVFVLASAWIVRESWGAAFQKDPRLPGALVVYALALTAMVVSIAGTTGGRLGLSYFALLGAICFYVGDATIALNIGGERIRHAWWLTSGVYWVGQFLIAWAARVGKG